MAMMLRKLLGSPLAWTALYCAALALLGLFQPAGPAHSAERERGKRANPAPAQQRRSGVWTPRNAAQAIPRFAPTGSYAGPRLRKPPSLDDTLGLDIAIEDRDGRSLDAFHRALRRAALGKGQAHILFYGASHVASDMFTGFVRTQLQSEFGDAGHGFVLPARPWRGYRHEGVRIENSKSGWESFKVRANTSTVDRYGLAGVYLVGSKSGTFGSVSTASRGPLGRSAERLELMYLNQPQGGSFRILLDGKLLRTVQTRGALGPAYFRHRANDGAHTLRIELQGDGPVRLFGSVLERSTPGVIVDTVGINGSRARYHLLWEDKIYREHLARRNPDLIVLAYGTNESGDDSPIEEYENQLRTVLRRIHEVLPKASCLLVGPSDRPVKRGGRRRGRRSRDLSFEDRPRTHLVNEAQYRMALEQGCGFFDVVAFQGGPLSTIDWVKHSPPFGAPDYIHFTRRGYQRLGRVLLDAMLERYTGPRKAMASAQGSRRSP